ncbi:tyrosine-type recombinase/integrase [Streptantibioticus rubrisoli]|uniref:Tyrosine-type recombinase/integrase n=1 Tax=Streptantibioticus rubrisoli TaxID=1387313 RepID=A0ABT1PES2_9ACTN|nr:tyrosine-type recombinase/integrase [Streptantibioticus rubrisoli]MCQ4043862.1 tyrosine-type recombinase/integrase [Streptantibioticus rubrisoli]
MSSELVPAPSSELAADVELSDGTRERLQRSAPENTKRAYTRQWQTFANWCSEQGRTPMPATPQTLAEYVSHLADLDRAPSTIEQAIAAIRTAHRFAGHRGQPETDAALAVLKVHRRDRAAAGKRKRKAPPVTLKPLRAMIEATNPETLAGKRDRALLVLGFALMARRSELAALQIEDMKFTDDGLTVLIRASKTDQDAAGAEVQVPNGVHPDTDPVRVVRAWLTALAEHDVTDGPLLRRINRWGQLQPGGMSGAAVNEAVQRVAAAAGLPNAVDFTAHGLRAGAPTEAAKAGHPTSFIAEHGRWSKTSPQVLEYIRPVDRWRDNPMRGIGL